MAHVRPGSRIVMVGSPWPEREGCAGVVVAPPADGTYPQPGNNEVLVLLDDDPLKATGTARRWSRGYAGWTCVVGAKNVRPAAPPEGTDAP